MSHSNLNVTIVHNFIKNKHFLFMKYSTDLPYFVWNALILQKGLKAYNILVSESICDVNYIHKYRASSSALFEWGWGPPLPLLVTLLHFIRSKISSIWSRLVADFIKISLFISISLQPSVEQFLFYFLWQLKKYIDILHHPFFFWIHFFYRYFLFILYKIIWNMCLICIKHKCIIY